MGSINKVAEKVNKMSIVKTVEEHEEVEMSDEKDESFTDMDDSMVSCFVKKGKKLTSSSKKFKNPDEGVKTRPIKPTFQEEEEENEESYSDFDSDNGTIVSGFVRNGKTKPRPLKNSRQTQVENMCRLCEASYDDLKLLNRHMKAKHR